MVSMSETGSTLPATCTTFASSKQRTTCAMASHSRILARNWLPSPSPFDAPATSPAISTNSTAAATTFCGLAIAAIRARRGSGTSTMPTLGFRVQLEHRRFHVAVEQQARGFHAAIERRFDQLSLGRGRRRQHVVGDEVLVPRVADADAQAPEPVRAELGGDVLETVVAGDPAAELQFRRPRWKIELVVHDQDFLRLDLVVARERADRLARDVHVSLRQKQ